MAGCATRPSEPATIDPDRLLAHLPAGCIAEWQPQSLPGKRTTRYAVGPAEDGRPVVRAQADRSASLVRHKLRIEPSQVGFVRFSWWVPALIVDGDVRSRDTEDSPARIVLAFDGDARRLGDRERLLFDLAEVLGGERPPFATLMYVWDASAPLDSVVINSRTARVRKIVVESGAEQLGRWRLHERDIAADFRRAYGEAPGALIGVALMTDADNTASRAQASYGPVCFAAAAAPTLRP